MTWDEFLTAFEQLDPEATIIDTSSPGVHFIPSRKSEEKPAFMPAPPSSSLNQDKCVRVQLH